MALFEVGKRAIVVLDSEQFDEIKRGHDVVIHAKATVVVLPPSATAAERVDAALALRGS